jgi:ornithine cyclodeaminase/alanine dehydrogenase-like protein (mu-crystallin family)
VLILSRAEVEAVLDPVALLAAVSASLQALSSGDFDGPPRQSVSTAAGSVLTMAGRRVDSPVVVKLVGVFPGNAARGREPHPSVISVLDASTGACLAVMDGEHITALRTAAAAALSTRACARADAAVLAVVGSGVQARAHLRMLPLVRPFSSVRLVARDPEAAARLGVVSGTVEGADVVS